MCPAERLLYSMRINISIPEVFKYLYVRRRQQKICFSIKNTVNSVYTKTWKENARREKRQMQGKKKILHERKKKLFFDELFTSSEFDWSHLSVPRLHASTSARFNTRLSWYHQGHAFFHLNRLSSHDPRSSTGQDRLGSNR